MASFLDRVVVGLDKGVNSVKEGSKTMVERARLNTQISNLEKNKARTMMNIGKAIYELHTNDELRVEQCEAMCESIDGMNAELSALNEKIQELDPESRSAAENIDASFEAAYRSDRSELSFFILSKKPAIPLIIGGGILCAEGIAVIVCCAVYNVPNYVSIINELKFVGTAFKADMMGVARFTSFASYGGLAFTTMAIAVILIIIGVIAAIRNR